MCPPGWTLSRSSSWDPHKRNDALSTDSWSTSLKPQPGLRWDDLFRHNLVHCLSKLWRKWLNVWHENETVIRYNDLKCDMGYEHESIPTKHLGHRLATDEWGRRVYRSSCVRPYSVDTTLITFYPRRTDLGIGPVFTRVRPWLKARSISPHFWYSRLGLTPPGCGYQNANNGPRSCLVFGPLSRSRNADI